MLIGAKRSLLKAPAVVAAGGDITQQNIIDLGPLQFLSLGDLTDAFVERTSPTTNVATDGDLIGYLTDLSGNGLHANSAIDDSYRPTYRIAATIKSIEFTTANSLRLSLSGAIQPTSCSVFFAIKPTSAVGVMISESYLTASDYAAIFQDGNGGNTHANAGSQTAHVDDGSAETSRDTFHDALYVGGGWHIVESRTADLSGFTNLYFPGYTGGGTAFSGEVGPDIIIIETASFSASDRTDTIIPYLQQGVGL